MKPGIELTLSGSVTSAKALLVYEVKVPVTQLCLTLCDPMDYSPPPPLSTKFSRQDYWRGLPFPPPGDLPDPGMEPKSPVLQADSLLSEPLGTLKTKELTPNLCICFSLFFLFRIHFVITAKRWCRSPHPRIRRTDALTRNDNAELGR